MPFTNVFRLIGKAFRSVTRRPVQRFNIYNRSKKYIGEESKHFFPAPRAIGPMTKIGVSQYPHLEGGSSFKSVKQRRIEAIEARNKRLLEASVNMTVANENSDTKLKIKSYSEVKDDDQLIAEAAAKLPVIKTIQMMGSAQSPTTTTTRESLPEGSADSNNSQMTKISRPLPKLTSLDLRNPASIWALDKVPPGRLDLNKLQELLVNKIADDAYWTPKQIAETYNIKEEYAGNLIAHLKQIRVVVSPRLAKTLDYVNRTNETYQATKHIIYIVDKTMRSDLDRSVDETFLPEDELDDSIRELLSVERPQKKIAAATGSNDKAGARSSLKSPSQLVKPYGINHKD